VSIRIDGTWIVIITIRNNFFTSSGFRIAFEAESTWSWSGTSDWFDDTTSYWVTSTSVALVSWLANDWFLNQSSFWMAFRNETFIRSMFSNDFITNVSENTFSGSGVARVFSTDVVIIADLW
jgi:hypothetical protein